MKARSNQGIRRGKGPLGMMGMGMDDDILSIRTVRVGGGVSGDEETRVVHSEQLNEIQKYFFKDNFNDKE
jgi:hypothetical protein